MSNVLEAAELFEGVLQAVGCDSFRHSGDHQEITVLCNISKVVITRISLSVDDDMDEL